MSIEVFLAVNLLADGLLLAAVTRALGLFNLKRVLAAAALGAAYGAAAVSRPLPWATIPVQLAMLVAVSAIAGGGSPRLWRAVGLALAFGALLCGGVGGVLGMRGPVAALHCVAIGGLLAAGLFAVRPPQTAGWHVRVCLEVEGKRARFPALIDTGNRLREPRTGLPVLIAEAALLKDALPEAGYRVLRFGAVGGEGSLACFKPSAVWIERGARRLRAPDLWVAVSPGPLPGLCRALAPGQFALYMK